MKEQKGEIIVNHIVLLGDSIFDNGKYVPGESAVIEQVRDLLPETDYATLLAVDGNVTSHVAGQLNKLPDDASHLFVSVGGNDAIGYAHILASGDRILSEMTDAYATFREHYRNMLDAVLNRGLPTTVCTIYDSIPGLEKEAVVTLSIFNDVILREAFERGLPVIDLRIVCGEAEDYSKLSPIEPSSIGGSKIARVIVELAQKHDFEAGRSSVY
jgi:hypothetical protein